MNPDPQSISLLSLIRMFWPIFIALAALISSVAVGFYRLKQTESGTKENKTAIAKLDDGVKGMLFDRRKGGAPIYLSNEVFAERFKEIKGMFSDTNLKIEAVSDKIPHIKDFNDALEEIRNAIKH